MPLGVQAHGKYLAWVMQAVRRPASPQPARASAFEMVTISKTRSTPQDRSNMAFREGVAAKAETIFFESCFRK